MGGAERSILFVDDEQSILKALRRVFMDEDWNIFFAESGEEGLEVLAQEDIDLVVSDFRMPIMDGAEFLGKVKEKNPDVMRMMLTGYVTKEAVTRLLAEGTVQQVLPKPWQDDELVSVVKRVVDLIGHLQTDDPGLLTIINKVTVLPELPTTYWQIDDLIKNVPGTSIDKLAEAVEQDVSLSAELLCWSNSALFGQMHKVETVKRAIVVLGLEVVKGLILSRNVSDVLLDKLSPALQDDIAFHQKHSTACGVMARLLAGDFVPEDVTLADRAFSAGLLHDLGVLVEIGQMAEQFQEVTRVSREENVYFMEIEERVLGTNHAEVGSYLATWWNLPPGLMAAIRWHHEPQSCEAESKLCEIIHIADYLVHQFGAGVNGSEQLPPLQDGILEKYSLTAEQLEKYRREVLEALE